MRIARSGTKFGANFAPYESGFNQTQPTLCVFAPPTNLDRSCNNLQCVALDVSMCGERGVEVEEDEEGGGDGKGYRSGHFRKYTKYPVRYWI